MNSFHFSPQQPSSLRHRVADTLRLAILSGQLKSGDRIREQELADQINVSRGPIREALSLLESEGLVVTFPYKETVVATLTHEEIVEILLPTRLTIESFVIKKAKDHLTDEDFDYLASLVRRMNLAADENDLAELVDLDMQFHRYLIRKAEQPTALSLWETIDGRIRLHFVNHGQEYVDLHEIAIEHHQLLEGLKSHNLKTTLDELRRHIYEMNI